MELRFKSWKASSSPSLIPYEQEPCPLIPESAAAASASPLQELVLTCLEEPELQRCVIEQGIWFGLISTTHYPVLTCNSTVESSTYRSNDDHPRRQRHPQQCRSHPPFDPRHCRVSIGREAGGAMDQLIIEVEDRQHEVARVVDLVDRRLGLRVEVVEVPEGTLPRATDKAKRFVGSTPTG